MPSHSYTSDKNKVQQFLKEFKTKLKIWGIYYRDDRGKNMQTLLDLDLRPNERTKIIKALEFTDYSQGPAEDDLYGGAELWVFGKTIKSAEVYIKITLGSKDNKTICISFHIAEHAINYPFR